MMQKNGKHGSENKTNNRKSATKKQKTRFGRIPKRALIMTG